MRLTLLMGAALALGIAPAGAALAQAAGAPDASSVVKAVMEDQYGSNYDAKNTCWVFKHGDGQNDPATYCMRAAKPEIVDGKSGKVMYLQAVNVNAPGYDYDMPQPGLMGAFRVKLGGKQGWTYDGLNNALEFGTAGQCGCTNAKLVKLSNAGDYGWIFSSGGTWQGVTVANYAIVATVKGGMKNVSSLPQVRENAQDITYDVTVKPGTAAGMYPVHVVKNKAKAKVDEFDVPFDAARSVYALPAGR